MTTTDDSDNECDTASAAIAVSSLHGIKVGNSTADYER